MTGEIPLATLDVLAMFLEGRLTRDQLQQHLAQLPADVRAAVHNRFGEMQPVGEALADGQAVYWPTTMDRKDLERLLADVIAADLPTDAARPHLSARSRRVRPTLDLHQKTTGYTHRRASRGRS